jgi:hypothetical protein
VTAIRPRSSQSWPFVVLVAVLAFASTSVVIVELGGGGITPATNASRVSQGTYGNHTLYWANVSGQSTLAPTPRSSPQAAYSPSLGVVILFGGYNPSVSADGDTWEFSGDQWTELGLSNAPPGRWAGSMVYDASDGYLLLFGGRNDTQFFNDTWSYNATGWHQITTTHAPSPRDSSAMIYDPSSGDVVLFGGSIGNVPVGSGSPWTSYNDTWTYHAGVWTNITAKAGTPPSPRSPEGMTYDSAAGYAILQGGGLGGPGPCITLYNDTWKFSDEQWSLLNALNAPPPSFIEGLAFDSAVNGTLLYQGMSYQPTCDSYSSQVWSFLDGDWTLVVPSSPGAPQGRAGPAWVYDPQDQAVILFGGAGGQSGYSYFGDTWELKAIAPLTMPTQFTVDRSSADVGQSASFTAGKVSGGLGPYHFDWKGLPAGCSGNSTPSASCTFLAPANLEVVVTVSDSLGSVITSAPIAFPVFADPTIASHPVADPDPVVLGGSVELSINVEGGSGGFTFVWEGLPSGCTSVDAPALLCQPAMSGTFDIGVIVNDTNGESAASQLWPEVVLAQSPPTSPPASPGHAPVALWASPYFLIGTGLILLAAVVLAWGWTRRRPPAPDRAPLTNPPRTPPPSS